MEKAKEELQERKETVEGANKEPKTLAEEELAQVSGGAVNVAQYSRMVKERYEAQQAAAAAAAAAEEEKNRQTSLPDFDKPVGSDIFNDVAVQLWFSDLGRKK